MAGHVVDMSKDVVRPPVDPKVTFEGKYALDSLASFLRLSRLFVEKIGDTTLFNDEEWLRALRAVLKVLQEQSDPTFDVQGGFVQPVYSFQRPSALSMDSLYNGPEVPANGKKSVRRRTCI